MTMQQIAAELVAGCREGRETHGRDGIRARHEWWESAFEQVEGEVSGPMPHGNDRFAVIFDVKVRNRETGQVDAMREVGVYHVAEGRIVREEFFYPTGRAEQSARDPLGPEKGGPMPESDQITTGNDPHRRRHRVMLMGLIWLGVYPVVTIMSYVTAPWETPLWIETFVTTILTVPLITYVVVPRAKKLIAAGGSER